MYGTDPVSSYLMTQQYSARLDQYQAQCDEAMICVSDTRTLAQLKNIVEQIKVAQVRLAFSFGDTQRLRAEIHEIDIQMLKMEHQKISKFARDGINVLRSRTAGGNARKGKFGPIRRLVEYLYRLETSPSTSLIWERLKQLVPVADEASEDLIEEIEDKFGIEFQEQKGETIWYIIDSRYEGKVTKKTVANTLAIIKSVENRTH